MIHAQVKTTTRLLAGFAMLALCGPAFSQEPQPGIDWAARVVRSKGIGAVNPKMPVSAARPGAIRAAKMDALRNALELVKGVTVTSSTTVANCMTESDQVRTRVEGYVKGFTLSEPHYMDDMTVEVYAEIPLDGVLSEAVLPAAVAASPSVVKWPSSSSAAQSPALDNGTVYTGLIVDARGLGVLPALAPRILAEDGQELYGAANVGRAWAVKYGMAGYAKTPEQARALKDRIGGNPGMLKAVKADGAAKTDLVLSNGDALQLKSSDKNLKYLSEARVVILVD